MTGQVVTRVAVLMSGTGLAQLLLFVSSPVLTRLYDPAAYGVLGVFSSSVAVIFVVACLRYDLAIVLPKDDRRAANVLALAGGSGLVVAAATGVLVVLARGWVSGSGRLAELAGVIWWAPGAVAAMGLYQAVSGWSIRREHFGDLALSRTVRSGAMVLLQVTAGVAGLGAPGLVAGQTCGQLVAGLVLAFRSLRRSWEAVLGAIRVDVIRSVAKEYADFPRFSAPQAVLDAVAQAVPALVLGGFFGPAVAGAFWFTYRLMYQATDLVGQSVRQVLLQEASSRHNAGMPLHPLLRHTTLALALAAAGPLVVCVGWAPQLFAALFGAEWRVAGEYARWLSLWWVGAFLLPPSVALVVVLGRQRQQLVFEAVLLAARLVALFSGVYLGRPLLSIAMLSAVGFLFNLGFVAYMFGSTFRLAPIPALAGDGDATSGYRDPVL